MLSKQIEYGENAKYKLMSGCNKLALAVGATLGPGGRNIIIEKDNGFPQSTRDGVTVAKSIKLKDPIENLGATIVKEAAAQTAEIAGDGTTTSTILAQTIINSSFKAISNGTNPIELKRGMDKVINLITHKLKTMSKDVLSNSEIENVGTISANNDAEIGKLIASAMDKVGHEGIITIEENKTSDTKLELVDGMQFKRGYISPYFINNQHDMSSVLEDALILIYDKRISAVKDILPILEGIAKINKSLLIIADDVEGEALAALVVNNVRGILKAVAVKAPEFGERKVHTLQDIATLTGGVLISPDKGMKLEDATMEMLGRAKKIIVTSKDTTIINGGGDQELIFERVAAIKEQIDNAESDYDRESLQERLAKLVGGVAILSIGAGTEIELKEKMDRVDDALHATRAAVEEGIIPGGGVAFMKIKEYIIRGDQLPNELPFEVTYENEDQKIGAQIVITALGAPFAKIITNCGKNADVIWNNITLEKAIASHFTGYDARNDKIVDLYNSGIVDPTKVARIAIEKAVSVAGTLITTEAVITNDQDELKELTKAAMMGQYAGGGGGYDGM